MVLLRMLRIIVLYYNDITKVNVIIQGDGHQETRKVTKYCIKQGTNTKNPHTMGTTTRRNQQQQNPLATGVEWCGLIHI